MADTRTETDSFGPLEVPSDKYWGAQTQRSIINFPIGWEKQPVPIIRALGVVKKACAMENLKQGNLERDVADAIVAAPTGGVADRFRHPIKYERKRSHFKPRNRDVGRRDGVEDPCSPQRPLQHGSVFERHVPDGDARGNRDADARRVDPRPAKTLRRAYG